MYKYLGNSCVLSRIYQPFITTFSPFLQKRERTVLEHTSVLKCQEFLCTNISNSFARLSMTLAYRKDTPCGSQSHKFSTYYTLFYCINKPSQELTIGHCQYQPPCTLGGRILPIILSVGEGSPEKDTFPRLQVYKREKKV